MSGATSLLMQVSQGGSILVPITLSVTGLVAPLYNGPLQRGFRTAISNVGYKYAGVYPLNAIPQFFMKASPINAIITSVVTGARNQWTIAGNYASEFSAGNIIIVSGNSNLAANGQYIISSALNSGASTNIEVSPSTIPAGAGNNGSLSLPRVKTGSQTVSAYLYAYMDYGYNLWYSVNGAAWVIAGSAYDGPPGQNWASATSSFNLTVPANGDVRWAHSAGPDWQNYYTSGQMTITLPNH